ncbi:T9SS type A sorting domain-containing protein [Flavobacterium sp. CSZ]|uniref:T9SS type A sorting domain-containing protein n=1 Tax=Flavobacterium sp. CSZ TaxID=2783791 RepID=UPI00188B5384|nr:T9SS type A sorting domain-containing protein [Flavobacterium sp. CSZ]MBF4483580.1 T9SS type A sorting domain-containing protein [Flavobacterium sp. CSZ]
MEHFYSQIKKFLNIALFLGIFLQSYIVNSQTLANGDLIFTGYDSNFSQTDGGDVFSFVLLTPIPAGTVINFTDRGYFETLTWQVVSGTEGSISWTSGTAIAAGTEVMIKGMTASTYNVATGATTTNGTVVITEGTMTNGLNLSFTGDQVIAFQGGAGSVTGSGVTLISGLHYFRCATAPGTSQATWDPDACANGTNGSIRPPALIAGTSAFYTGGSTPSAAKFNLSSTDPITTIAQIRTAVMNPSNWTLSAISLAMPSAAPFLGTPPAITGNPPNRTLCIGGTTTFPITATNASGYQWQENTGSGFANLSNTAPYSGVTSATLTITGVTAAMSGYTYRCIASGTGTATSNPATLTVPSTTVITTAQSNVTCNGGNNGSATVSASGSFPPYTYLWSSSAGTAATATNLTAGTYTVTATDNIGCPTPYTVTITEPTLAASSPSITTQPASYSACTGSTASFTVAATNTATYQWQVDNGSGYANITNGGASPNYSGSNTANLSISSITSGMNGYSYRVVLTSSCSNTIASNGLAQLNVTSLPVATAIPASASICSGTSPNIALTSAPGGATFSWTVVTTSGTVTGASASSGTSINQTLTGNGIVTYTVTPSLNSCSGTPITVVITVNPLPSIAAQPSASTICAGANTTFSVTATNATGYQWQVDQGAGFSNISNGAPYSGATTATLTITGATTGLNGYVYRAVATGTCIPNAVSNAAALTINSAPGITTQPSASTICVGANATFSVTASGATGYQWQVDQGAGFSNIANGAPYSGATTATLTITGATVGLNGYVYRVVATGACTPDAVSNTAALTINSAPAITTQPSNSITCLGTNATFTVAASNATGYQWQVNQGAGFFNIPNIAPYSGATTATLTITGVTADMDGYVYRVVTTGLCTPAATSSARTLTIPIIIAGASQTNIACNGVATGIATVSPTGGTAPYTFLWSNNAITSSISGLTAGTYSVTIKDANQCEKIQNFTITEPPVLVASQGAINNVSCNGGSNGTATVNVTGGTGIGSYTYSWAPTGGSAATASGLAAGTYTVTVTDANSCQKTLPFTITEPAALAVTSSQVDILCNGSATGSATLNATGGTGTGTYTYSWAPSGGTAATATGLTAGTYTVTITDANSCSTTKSITITEPLTPLTASQGTTVNVNCYGQTTGSATVNVTGGTGSYSYSWAPSGGTGATASGLSAGNYTVTIFDDNGCMTSQNFNISQPGAALSASTSSTGVSCYNGSNGTASVTVSGGTPNYTYSWAPSGGTADTATGLTAGNYTCTITDSKGCILIQPVTVSGPSALSSTIAKVDVSCNGGTNGSATVTASGGTGAYTYSWAPTGGNAATASGLPQGTYTVTVTDANSCFITQSVTIDQPASLTVIPSQTDVLCNGGATATATVTTSGGTLPYTYAWSPAGGTDATATGLSVGNYACMITDANGCTFTQFFAISEPPTLTSSITKIDATCLIGGQSTVSVNGGTLPYSYSWSPSGGNAATATGLSAGNYTVIVTDGNGCTTTQNTVIGTTNTLVATTSQTDVLCNGANTGSASVVPSGAPGPFSYVWAPSGGNSDTASNLTAGNYSVTITSANGCSIVKNFTITEPSALTVTPSQIDLLCNGGTTGQASVSVTGGTGAYTYAWSPSGGNAATATGLTAGTYMVTITDGNLCQTTQSFTITEPNALTATIAPTNVSCNGGTNGSATVTVSGGTGAYTYAWAPTGGTADTATGLSAGTYTVTITDANSCTTTQSVTLTEPAVLVASVGSQSDITCNGLNNGSATVNVTGGTGTYTYAWSPSGGTADTATGLSPGTYTVTVTDANSCTVNQSFTIIEPAVLTSSITGQTYILCNGGTTGSATVTAIGGTGAYTYSWSPSGGTADTATGLSAGTYTVTVTDAKSCTTTQSVTITEPNALTATIVPTNVSCNGGTTGAATVTATGGTGAYTYAWSPSGGTAATATELTAGTYIVTVTDANSCTTTQSVTITEPAALVASVGGQNNVTCNGLNNGSATVIATGGTGTYTYAWSPSGGTADTATGLSPGVYTVIVTDANNCTATQSFTITEPAVLTATITGQTDVTCNGQANGSATVTATGGTGLYTYAWSPSGGTADTATGLSGGTYTVTITDVNNCATTQSVTITEPNALTATIAPTNVSCNGGTTGAATVTATGGTGTYTYAWAPSGGTAATATQLTAGTYVVTVTDANSCTTTQSVTITQPAALIASVGGQSDVTCNGLNNGSANVIATGGTGTYTYAWSPSGGTADTATGLSPGVYTVTVTDTNNCTANQSFIITQPAVLTASITGQTDVTCNGQANGSATVTATGGTGTYTYLWSPSGGNAATATGLSGGTYTVTVTDANSCTTTQSVTITEPNALSATIAPTNVSCNGGTTGAATVTATGGSGTYTYSWSPSGGTAATATGLTAGTYTVTVTDANSCTTTQSVTVTEPSLIVASITTKTDVTCNGASNGSATVTATGGTGAYTYVWAPSGGNAATATGLNIGIYTVTVTDVNGCSATQNVTISEPSALTATTTQTDVTCMGATDGSASVTATGGTGTYTYAWSPSGGNAATATGLIAGNYTVTITDANGCSVTKSLSIITIPDVTAPVPNLATLPTITASCSITAAQIPVPTATDNCAGIIKATTTSPLSYTAVGTYTITWTYDDGHGNTSSQNQTINVTASSLDQVTFSNAEYTFDGNLHSLQVENLPAGASVAYTITPAASTQNGAINAGIYTVTAIVSPSASTPNCLPITLTAQLTINKAPQQITFDAIPAKILGANNNFNLEATSSSGLPIRYSFTYTSALPPANVSAIGLVNLLRSGDLVIVAHQDGNENYLPAANVEQVLVIKNNDITIPKITLGSKVYQNPAKEIKYLMECGENNPNVAFSNETGATFTPSANFTITTPKPGIYTQNVTVTSQDGTATAMYALTIEKPFGFYDIVHQKFNNVLLINNNPQTNGGYEFVSYQWFKNGQLVGTGQYYSAGDDLANSLDTSADYSVKMTTKDGKTLQTCSAKITTQKSLVARLYPNPIQTGQVITVEADFPAEELENMQISLYSVSGQLIKTLKSSTVRTEVQLPDAESNMYVVVIETANIKKTLKVIVNK